jgi:hypothetical protein
MRDHLSPREQREPPGAAMMLPQAADRDEWFVRPVDGDFKMRKLILIAAIAFVTATPCYANLSLASADTSPTATEQSKTTAEAPPVTNAGSPARISRRGQHHWAASRLSLHHFGYRYFGGGC